MNKPTKNTPADLHFLKTMAAIIFKKPSVGCLFLKMMAAMFFKNACVLALFAACCFSLTGCNLQAQEDTGGIASPQASNSDNKVNPSQDADSSFLYDTSIADLTGSSAAILDEQTVQVLGEVVGDARTVDFDSEHFWITLQAEEDRKYNTITIFCTKTTTDLIDTFGSYGRRGTTLQVRGTFNLTCDEHDGLCDIHAESSSVRARGNSVNPPLRFESLSFGFTMLVFGAVMIAIYVYVAKAKRKKLEEEQAQEDEDDEDI